jgi:imidazole glycerol-phosphate synthase subunit HisH
MTIGIVAVGIGNLGSIKQALFNLGWDPVMVSDAKDFADITHLILPGVGAFSSAMQKLNQAGLVDSIQKFAASGRPVLGICLGMQLLATLGTEGEATAGLNLVPGRVERFPDAQKLRIPHVGWNEAKLKRFHPLLKGIRTNVDFYFVHSYHFVADKEEDILCETDYGVGFSSMVGRGNVVGTQFHPEKSQSNGLRLLDNFCSWSGKC